MRSLPVQSSGPPLAARDRPRRRRRRQGERGAILIVVLLIMITILGLGVTALWLTSGNLQVGGNVNLRTQALYVAEAGLERAFAALNAPAAPDLDAVLAGSNPSIDNVPTDVDSAGQPNGVGAVLVDGATALSNVAFPPASFGRTSGAADSPIASTMGSYTVWIRNDLGEIRRGLYTDDQNDTVMIRSRGVASDGRTNVVLEVTMVPRALVNDPGGANEADRCFGGKNACDDNTSTQYGVTYGGS